MLQGFDQTLTLVNDVLSGQRAVQVEAKVPVTDALMLGGVIFLSMFAAVSLAMYLFQK